MMVGVLLESCVKTDNTKKGVEGGNMLYKSSVESWQANQLVINGADGSVKVLL